MIYLVEIPATTFETYAIEADSPGEAKAKVADGDGHQVIDGYVPDWDQDRSKWRVKQQKEISLSKGTLTIWNEIE